MNSVTDLDLDNQIVALHARASAEAPAISPRRYVAVDRWVEYQKRALSTSQKSETVTQYL